MSKANAQDLTAFVDELGTIRAQKKAIEKRETELKNIMVEAGFTDFEAETFKALRVEQMRTMVDWKAVAAKLEPSPQLVTAHTTKKEIISIRTSIRPEAIA